MNSQPFITLIRKSPPPLFIVYIIQYIDDNKYCEECINDSKVILDVDEYTYQDYLCDKYESERHDV